jgi:DNA-binding response OmpR family regulator
MVPGRGRGGDGSRVQRIAVVHPNHAVRALAAQILAANGFAPVEAETVEDAVSILATDPPVVAVVNENLVGDLRSWGVPIIGLAMPGSRFRLIDAGARCVVDKPFTAEDLLRAVRWVLEVYTPGIT